MENIMSDVFDAIDENNLGDMPIEDFRSHGYKMVDWMCDYFDTIESYPVVPNIAPGDIKKQLPDSAPNSGEPFDAIFDDFKKYSNAGCDPLESSEF